MVEPPPPTELTQAPVRFDDEMEDDNNDLRTGSSAKIDQLVTLLRLTPETDKSLVFSQFTSFLDKVSVPWGMRTLLECQPNRSCQIAETLDKEGYVLIFRGDENPLLMPKYLGSRMFASTARCLLVVDRRPSRVSLFPSSLTRLHHGL